VGRVCSTIYQLSFAPNVTSIAKQKTKIYFEIMNKQVAKELQGFVEEVGKRFSYNNRDGNFNKESFSIKEIIPTSDHTASVIFEKNTGKMACFFFYYINRGASKGWKYFVPTDSHITGFRAFEYFKLQVERSNYKHNF
jgi:hypothetical protein